MSGVDRYGLRGLGLGINIDFHKEDMELGLSTQAFLYSTGCLQTLEAHVELSNGDVVKMDEGSWAQHGFIRGNLPNNSKVHYNPCWGLLSNSHGD